MLKESITSIAIGGFDGMHLAHQELFKKLDKNGAIVVIESGYANLTPKTVRAKYTNLPFFYYPLDAIKHLETNHFIKLLKEEYPNLKKIVVGFDFRFGARASGDIQTLQKLFDGEVIIVDEFRYNNEAIHSRVIRSYLSDGDIQTANKYLNKNYTIEGHVIDGQGLGKKQFVPTLNLDVEDFLLPQEGIYATYSICNNKRYKSVTFLGHRVTTDGRYAIETHIIDEDIEFVSNKVAIEFITKIRNNKKYEKYEDLKEQILKDIDTSKKLLN